MQTLYELLGALPEDDAEGIRTAFRNAAKACHPDNNPDDPDAAYRFRQVTRAYSILRDETQRAAYDSLMGEAEMERRAGSRRGLFSEAGLPGPLTSMVIACVSIGAFVGLERALTIPDIPQWKHISARLMALTAALPAPASSTIEPGTVGRVSEQHKSDPMLSYNKILAAQDLQKEPQQEAQNEPQQEPPKEAETPRAVEKITASVILATAGPVTGAIPDQATADHDGVTSAIAEPEVKDAGYYRERGSMAYRSGDLALALTDFDLAISLDPNSSDAYVNRAIVFRRMGDLKHALADISQAKRIDERKPQ